MRNPWEEIDLNDYENHMRLNNVLQLQAMNEMMKKQFYSYKINSIMVLGIAGGNGLEHIKRDSFQAIYGVDINQKYLDECKKRYPELKNVFIPICADLSSDKIRLPHSDLLIANLIIEYIGHKSFQNIVKLVRPRYISCIIQLNTDDTFVSDSPYLHVFDNLKKIYHQIEETDLINSMREMGYAKKLVEEKGLPNEKKLLRIDFYRTIKT